jgi:hypothetical protein
MYMQLCYTNSVCASQGMMLLLLLLLFLLTSSTFLRTSQIFSALSQTAGIQMCFSSQGEKDFSSALAQSSFDPKQLCDTIDAAKAVATQKEVRPLFPSPSPLCAVSPPCLCCVGVCAFCLWLMASNSTHTG